MNVQIKFGRHAGEVRDIAPEAALAMLADGRAERPGDTPFGLPQEVVSEIMEMAYGPAEVAAPCAVKPEEIGEMYVGVDLSSREEIVPARRKRSRR